MLPELVQNNYCFTTTTDSEVIAFAIAHEINTGKDWVEGIIAACQRCQGAFSLVIGTSIGLIGVPDPNGIRPLVIGTLNSKNCNVSSRYVLSSETCGLDIIGAKYLRDVEPGELVWIDQEKITSFNWTEHSERKLCIFEMIYFARPDSEMHSESLYSYRLRLGQYLAKESPANADFVIPVPDSGVPAAIGFSQISGIPYAEGLIKSKRILMHILFLITQF
ncbi:MAG: hypothetical protein KME30_28745 [Iphinoe sp. HA4291-MV1]|jgi:amidophosphoribosyltransferase|nr:hypothetical protein [Iphinoe sp. HA4291-MV1]